MLSEALKVFNNIQNFEEENYVIKGITKEEVISELKIYIKKSKPICINEAFSTESDSYDGFIEYSREDERVYIEYTEQIHIKIHMI